MPCSWRSARGWNGIAGATGRNSKALNAWVRSQWNLAPADPDDESKLILACGKNNNGKPFGEIGVVYDEEVGVYRIDGDFDAERYREAIGADGKRRKPGLGRQYSADDILECLGTEWMRVSALQRRVYEETGMSKARFYVIWPEIKETLRVDRNERGKYRRGGGIGWVVAEDLRIAGLGSPTAVGPGSEGNWCGPSQESRDIVRSPGWAMTESCYSSLEPSPRLHPDGNPVTDRRIQH